jgi:flagellar hook-length control protein FliK
MIPGQVSKSPDTAAVTETAASSAAPGAARAATAGAGTPFDVVLALETCAASLSELAGQANLEIDAGELPDDTDSDDGTDEAEPLAFLAGLLGMAVVPTQAANGPPAGTANAAESSPELGIAGTQPHAGGANADLPADIVADTKTKQGGEFIAAVDALAAAPVEGGDRAAESAPPALRAAEWMTHGVRQASPAAESQVISTPVRDPRWTDDFATRVSLMVRGGESTASLQLTPVDLGPMDVNVTVKDGQASVHFGAAHSETRALIEASLPRLREMLAAQGFNLMDASVSQGFARQARQDAPAATNQAVEPEVETRTARPVHLTSLLDLYA